MPVLARDARRLADAQRCRTGGEVSAGARLGVLRAVTAGALDRATDVAATLEVRGFGAGHRPARRRRPWSRHDFAFAASIGAMGLGVVAAASGWDPFDAYPRTYAPIDANVLVLALALPACVLAPFLDRRGIE
jgi:energy-coupling factor transport system permease protein